MTRKMLNCIFSSSLLTIAEGGIEIVKPSAVGLSLTVR
jgi:hypothetical protein